MRTDTDFHAAYRELEKRMKAQAEADGHVFLPNPEPDGPVDYVFICMEPSRSWAGSAEAAEAKVDEGFRNFLPSDEVSILHFCIRSYLCGSGERYHITDLSKGAMPVDDADEDRFERWDKWYPLLQEEIALVATPSARIVPVGKVVGHYLERRPLARSITPSVVHYSPLAARARNAAIEVHKDAFEGFKASVSIEDVVATAKEVLAAARMPFEIRKETLLKLEKWKLTLSRQKLMFIYKLAFDKMRESRYNVRKAPHIAQFCAS
jgi:hypothetical protein